MQGGKTREIEWAPAKAAPPSLVHEESSSQEYGLWQQAAAFGREQCLGRNAKGNRARRVSAVRRLLPPPAAIKRKPIIFRPMQWVDVAGRALRRTWTAHWRQQYVEVLPVAQAQPAEKPPARPPRAVRSHHGWSWHDRLARNACWGPPQLRVTVAGVPAILAINSHRRNW
jgi:hypothetical protein